MIGNYVNERRDCSSTTCIACTAGALMQFPRYPAGLSRSVRFQRAFFKSPLKTSTELGLRHGCGKTNRVTLIICAGFWKPEGISNSEAMVEWMTVCETNAWYTQKKKRNISKAAFITNDWKKEIFPVIAEHQSRF